MRTKKKKEKKKLRKCKTCVITDLERVAGEETELLLMTDTAAFSMAETAMFLFFFILLSSKMEVSRTFDTLLHVRGVLRTPRWKLLEKPIPKSNVEEEGDLWIAIGVEHGGDTAAMADRLRLPAKVNEEEMLGFPPYLSFLFSFLFLWERERSKKKKKNLFYHLLNEFVYLFIFYF